MIAVWKHLTTPSITTQRSYNPVYCSGWTRLDFITHVVEPVSLRVETCISFTLPIQFGVLCCPFGFIAPATIGNNRYKCHQGSKMSLFENSRWRRQPSWKIHKGAYLGQFFINLHQIWYGDRYDPRKCHRALKMSLFGNLRWRRPPSWKIHKRVYLSQFLTDLHQTQHLVT